MACFGRARRRREATRVASRIPERPAIKAIRGPGLLWEGRFESATATGLISCGSVLGIGSVGGLGEPAPAAASGGGDDAGGLTEGLAEGETEALADGEGEAFFAAADAEADGFADGVADGFPAAGAATGAGGGGAGAGRGAGGGASPPPSHPAPGDDWLPATWGDTGGVELDGDAFPPNSTAAKT